MKPSMLMENIFLEVTGQEIILPLLVDLIYGKV